jgi:hypothetical protein
MPSPVAWRSFSPEQLDIVQAIVEGLDWPKILDRLPTDDVLLTRTIIEMRKNKLVRY